MDSKNIFLFSLGFTLEHEGTYSNDPDDPGAETYRGISRRYHPNWRGWDLVDMFKNVETGEFDSESVANSSQDGELADMVEEFYRVEFWEALGLDGMSPRFAAVSACLFDSAVNMGHRAASRQLQRAVGSRPDGKIGPKTLARIYRGDPRRIVPHMLAHRANGYLVRIMKSPIKKKYHRGWMNRLFALSQNVTENL